MENKKGVKTTNAFQKILNKSKRKPKKIWVDKGSRFYSRSMKSWSVKGECIQRIMKENLLLLKDSLEP